MLRQTYYVTVDFTGAVSCNQSWQGSGPYAGNSGGYAVSNGQTEGPTELIGTYTWTCVGPQGGTASQTATISVVSPPNVSLSASSYQIPPGGTYTLYWGSLNSSSCDLYWSPSGSGVWQGPSAITPQSSNGATSGSSATSIIGTWEYICYGWVGDYNYTDITITQTPAPTCSISISPNPSPYAHSGTPVTLSWSSSNANNVYINSVGWAGTSGSTAVASQTSTNYSCYGWSSAYGNGSWVPTTLTVNPPPAPTATITASPSAIQTGQSSTISATYAAGSGDALTSTDIEEPLSNVLKSGSPASSLSYTFNPSTAGTYTFYARATTDYYTSWATPRKRV